MAGGVSAWPRHKIWTHKRPALQIMQVSTDGPFNKSRIWYSQFYNPRERAPQILERVTGVHGVKGCPSRREFAEQHQRSGISHVT
jgi:3-ketosteroid 9alpha-monooxygenase subunit A